MARSHHRSLLVGLAASVAALGLLAGCGEKAEDTAAAATGGISVADGWVRATEGTDDPSMTGAFMQIKNDTDSQVTLVGASTEVAGMTEIHEMVMKDSGMVMQKIEGGLEIPAGELAVLQPGGSHVMLMQVTDELAPGDEVTLTLEFADGQTEELTLPVKAFTEEEGHYHESPGSEDGMDGDMDGEEMDESASPSM
jgi:periplasmic copper chaperone A